MIFGRKKKNADEVVAEPSEATTGSSDLDAAGEPPAADSPEEQPNDAAATPGAGREAETADESAAGGERDWAAYDLSADWREDGPYDVEEVDLEADQVQRLDLGALIITPPPGAQLQLQVAQGTETIISALVMHGESALELSVFSAPRTPGLWAETREQIIEQTLAGQGSADCVEGPFGTELVRNLPVQLPDGRVGVQVTRTWVAEGPRWLLRGVVMGKAALSNEVDNDLVGPLFDTFCDVIVRRGEEPKPVGDLMPLQLPAGAQMQRMPTQE